MVKRILKIVGIVLAAFLVIAGGAIGIAFAAGAFEKEKIEITKIFLDENDQTSTSKTIYTLDNFVQNIKFYPSDATETDLKIIVSGNDNGVIESLPSTIKAGEDFEVKVKKDAKGNNIGGVVTIKAVSSSGLADVTLRVIVDVNIPDNSLFFSGSTSGKISTTGKSFTMPISDDTQYVYLKSNLVNAFYLPVGNNNNLKGAYVNCTYYDKNGAKIGDSLDLSENINVESIYNAQEGKYNFYYKIPIQATEAGSIDIEAKMHRTYEIQQAYEDGEFDLLVELIENYLKTNLDRYKNQADSILLNYNAFLDKYIKYFDTSDESYNFFKDCIPAGYFNFSINDLEYIKKSLSFVFVNCKATINVTAIKLDSFTSLATPKVYNVFEDNIYSLVGTSEQNIIDQFSLNITTDKGPSGTSGEEESYLFESLKLKPYLYLDSSNLSDDNFTNIDDKDMIVWAGRNYQFVRVYDFDDNTPIITPYPNSTNVVGYLLQLTNQDEYLSITELTINGERNWKISCNTPLPVSQSNEKFKALYIGFEVSGIAEDNTMISIESYTRIYINYEDFDFISGDNIAFDNIDSAMTINTSLSNSSSLTSGLYTQDISINVNDDIVDNLDVVSYTSVMYFVETESNVIDSGSKVATLGKYKFVNFFNSNKADSSIKYFQYKENTDLVGERIATYRNVRVLDDSGNAIKDAKGADIYKKQYYLHALNASTEPVKIFAVVYLSDASGNPIDINGRKISVDESDQTDGNYPALVVVRISNYQDTAMPTVTINSYVDEINFYTQSLISYNIGSVNLSSGYLNRNSINTFVDAEGNALVESELKELQNYLKLKLLKDNYFTIYVTTFELDSSGNIATQDNTTQELSLKDVYGKEVTKSYVINTMSNKQIAFNYLCANFEYFSLYTGTGVEILPSETKILGDGKDGLFVYNETTKSNATMIKYVLHATNDSIKDNIVENENNQNSIIYLYYPEAGPTTIPYSNLMSGASTVKNNFVIYEANELKVDSIELDDVDMYTKLFARYAEGSNNGELEFRVPSLTGNSLTRKDYSLNLEEGNIKYTATTNLIGSDNEIDLSVVDCSQAGTQIDIPSNNNDESSYYYLTIEDYIKHYIVGHNGTQITYTNPDNVMSFAETYVFNNINQQGEYTDCIYFGSKTFEIEGNTINVNGYVLNLTTNGDEYRFTINQGEYFPIVEGNKALIYNELFTIFTDAGDSNVKYIYEFASSVNGGERISVNTSAELTLASGETNKQYNANTYVNDSNNSALNINNEGTSAKVKFVQGEEIGSYQEDPNGTYKRVVNGNKVSYEKLTASDSDFKGTRYSVKPVYVEDKNGNLYFNESTQAYESIPSNITPSVRYSKKGVIVYLLVTFNVVKIDNETSEFTFYKAIAYELVQEEIDIVGINEMSNGTESINSSNNKLKVTAGQSTKIYFNTAQRASDAKIVTRASDEKYFFNHVTLGEFNTTYDIDCEIVKGSSGQNEYIEITVPNMVKNDSITLPLVYKYKGVENNCFELEIELVANIAFETSLNSEEFTIDENTSYNVYKISLANNNTYEITEGLIKTYFSTDIGNDKQIKRVNLSKLDVGSTNLCTINCDGNNNQITLANCYADYNGDSINKDFVLCDIILVLEGNQTITLPTKLYIEIIPTYVIDLNELDEDIRIYNNENIFANYVRLFNNNITLQTIKDTNNIITDLSKYTSVFTITAIGNNADMVEINGGQIKLKSIPTSDTTVELNIAYIDNGYTYNKAFSVVIRGVALNTTSLGATCKESNNQSTALNANMTVTLESNETFDIDNYLNFTLATLEDNQNIQACLLDSNNNIIADSSVNAGSTYKIAYARFVGNTLVLVDITDYTLTIN